MTPCVPKNCIVGQKWNRESCKCEKTSLAKPGVPVKKSPNPVTKKPKLFKKGGMLKAKKKK
jgi:hypothetical protein